MSDTGAKVEEIRHVIEHLEELEEWASGPGSVTMGWYPYCALLKDARIELGFWRVRLDWITMGLASKQADERAT